MIFYRALGPNEWIGVVAGNVLVDGGVSMAATKGCGEMTISSALPTSSTTGICTVYRLPQLFKRCRFGEALLSDKSHVLSELDSKL